MTRAFALELAPRASWSTPSCPARLAPAGVTSPGEWDAAPSSAPLQRESSADDIAELIATLLKLETITGETIRVDSGRHIVGTRRGERH